MNGLATTQQQAAATANGDGPESLPPLPFVAGAREGVRVFHDETTPLSTTATQVGPTSVVAQGFLRSILLEIELGDGDGGTTAGVFSTDGVVGGVLEQVRLTDQNGQSLVNVTGFELYLVNKFGGRTPAMPDPASEPHYFASGLNGQHKIHLRVPVEVSGRDAFGCLANQSSSNTFQLEYTIAPQADVFATVPAPTVPSVRVKASLEFWHPPAATGPGGRRIAQVPPAHGSIQMVNSVPYDVEAGSQEIRINRVGNMYRRLIMIARSLGGDRLNSMLPDIIELAYDHQQVERISRDAHRARQAALYGLDGSAESPGGLNDGVLLWDWDHDLDGVPGWSTRRQFLATTNATDLRVIGDFGSAGKVHIVSVDVAPQGQFVGA